MRASTCSSIQEAAPGLRALLQQRPDKSMTTDTSLVTSSYYRETSNSSTSSCMATRAHKTATATISSPKQLELHDVECTNSDFQSTAAANVKDSSLMGRNTPEKTSSDRSNVGGGMMPPISLIGDVIDERFDVRNATIESAYSGGALWMKEEPGWNLDERTADPRTAYILSNLRAGLREQQNKTGTSASNYKHTLELDNAARFSSKRKRTDSSGHVTTAEKQTRNRDVTELRSAEGVMTTTVDDEDPLLRSIPSPERLSKQVQSTMTSYITNSNALARRDVIALSRPSVGVQCDIIMATSSDTSLVGDVDNCKDSKDAKTARNDCVINTNDKDELSVRPNDDNEFQCAHCNIDFRDAVLHSIHMGCHNLNEPFCCNICGSKCVDKYAFYTHIMRGHN